MPRKRPTPEPSVRRPPSERAVRMEVDRQIAQEAQRQADEAKAGAAAEKAARRRSAATTKKTTAPTTRGSKRKSPAEDGPLPKKPKSTSTPPKPRGRKPAPKRPTPAPVEIDYPLLASSIAQTLDPSIARQIGHTVHAALLPCLGLIDPMMQYSLACSGLTGDAELAAQTVGTRVVDAVQRVKREWVDVLDSPGEGEVPDDVFEASFGGD